MRSPGLPQATGSAWFLVVVRLSQIARRGQEKGAEGGGRRGSRKNLPMALEPPTPAVNDAMSGASVQTGSAVRVLARSPSGSRPVAMVESRDFAHRR